LLMVRWLGRLLLLVLVGPGVPWAQAEGFLEVHQFQSGGDVVVRSLGPGSDGKFELTFSRRAGGISSWYDLDRDPGRSHNLAGHGDLPRVALFMHSLLPVTSRGTKLLYSAPADTITVLENNQVRVRLLLVGVYSQLQVAERLPGSVGSRDPRAGDKGRDPDTRFATTYTVYPTGQLYVHHRILHRGTMLRVAESCWALATEPTSQFQVLGSPVEREPRTWSDFVLHTSSGLECRADALLVPVRPHLPVSRWGERFMVGAEQMGATRTAFRTPPAGSSIGEGAPPWCFLLQIEPDWMDQAGLAAIVAEAYQKPPVLRVEPGDGQLSRGDVGDDNLDGFSESEGCYTLRATPSGCRFSVDLSDTLLATPVFRFSNWQGGPPATLRVNGQQWSRGRRFQAVLLDQSTLLVQLYRNLTGDRVEVEVATKGAASRSGRGPIGR